MRELVTAKGDEGRRKRLGGRWTLKGQEEVASVGG